ncbi:MAG: tetratricopeptide repeat protein [Candidatus Thorarchaeota archaeon]
MDEKRKRFEANNFIEFGINLYQRLDYEKAAKCFQKALHLVPDSKIAKEYLEKLRSKVPLSVDYLRSVPSDSRKRKSKSESSKISRKRPDTSKERKPLADKKSRFRKVLSKSPKSTGSKKNLPSDLIDQKKYHEALVAFDEADEQSTDVDMDFAKTRIEIIILADRFGVDPGNPVYNPDYTAPEYMVSWIQWADSALRQGKNRDVIELCRAILRVDENHKMGWYWLGLAQFHSGLIDEAFASFTKAADSGTGVIFERSAKKLTVVWGPNHNGRVRGLKPTDAVEKSDIEVEALVERGMNLSLKKKHAEADEVLRKALEIEPNHLIALRFYKGPKPKVTSTTWEKWGEYLERIGKTHEAEQAFQTAVEMDKSNKKAASKSRKMKKERARKEKEQEPLKTGFELVEEVRSILKKTSSGKKKKGARAQSIPAEAKDHYKRGLDFETNQEYELALNSHLRAIKIFPQYSECWCALGPPLFRLNWKSEAEEVTKKAIEIDDSIPKVWADYGALLLYLSRYDESEKALLKALKLNPNNSYAWNNLGTCYSISDKKGKAENAFREAIRSDPNDQLPWLSLGSLLDQLDRRKEAEEAYSRFLKLAPPDGAMKVDLARQAAAHNRRYRRS